MKIDMSKICTVGSQARDLGKSQCGSSPGAMCCQNSFLLGGIGGSFFVLSRPSTDCTRPTHIIENHMLYSKATDVNVNLI